MLAASARRRASSEIVLACSSSPISASFSARASQRRQRGRIEPVGEQREIALRGDRHDGEDVVAQRALQHEVERDRRRHREGGGKYRHRQARRQHARHRDDQQHHEQHEGARAFVDADRMDQDEHPGQPVEQIEHDEAQPPGCGADVGHRQLARNCRHLLIMTAWMTSTDAVQAPAVIAPVHRLDRKPMVADQQQDHQRRGQPVLRVLAQQFVVEGRARAARRGQPVARLAHILRGKSPLHRRGRRRQRGEIGLFAWNRH